MEVIMSSALASFNKLPKVVQVILLLIPGVNLITEIIVRISAACHGKAGLQILALLLAIVTGGLFAWIDLIVVIIKNRLCLT